MPTITREQQHPIPLHPARARQTRRSRREFPWSPPPSSSDRRQPSRPPPVVPVQIQHARHVGKRRIVAPSSPASTSAILDVTIRVIHLRTLVPRDVLHPPLKRLRARSPAPSPRAQRPQRASTAFLGRSNARRGIQNELVSVCDDVPASSLSPTARAASSSSSSLHSASSSSTRSEPPGVVPGVHELDVRLDERANGVKSVLIERVVARAREHPAEARPRPTPVTSSRAIPGRERPLSRGETRDEVEGEERRASGVD